MKKKITEENAAGMVLDALLKQTEKSWEEIWLTLQDLLGKTSRPLTDKNYARLNFLLATIALNMRAGFDVYDKARAERLMTYMVKILEKLFGEGEKFETVRTSLMRYIEAYNQGIYNIRNPVIDVSMVMFGMMDQEAMMLKIVGEANARPLTQPVLQFLTNSLMLFAGKWEIINNNFDVVVRSQQPGGKAPPTR
jgi:hypothetical protein